MELTKGSVVTVSVKALYDEVCHPRYVHIVPDFDAAGNMAYFDLYNKKDELACLDGERCRVTGRSDRKITLVNASGDKPVEFSLTAGEADICCFVEKPGRPIH